MEGHNAQQPTASLAEVNTGKRKRSEGEVDSEARPSLHCALSNSCRHIVSYFTAFRLQLDVLIVTQDPTAIKIREDVSCFHNPDRAIITSTTPSIQNNDPGASGGQLAPGSRNHGPVAPATMPETHRKVPGIAVGTLDAAGLVNLRSGASKDPATLPASPQAGLSQEAVLQLRQQQLQAVHQRQQAAVGGRQAVTRTPLVNRCPVRIALGLSTDAFFETFRGVQQWNSVIAVLEYYLAHAKLILSQVPEHPVSPALLEAVKAVESEMLLVALKAGVVV